MGVDTQPANKMDELAVYITHRLGTVDFRKLSIIMYLSDLEHYLKHGSTITGKRHVKREYGPEPDGLRDSVFRLLQEGRLVLASPE